jgi:hypothetical protein
MTDNVVPLNGQFRFAEQEKVYWPVEVLQFGETPDEDNKAQIQWLVTVPKRDIFEKLSRLEQEARQHADRLLTGNQLGDDGMKIGRDLAKIVHDNVHGWRGIVGEDGEEVPVNKTNKQKLLENTRLFNSAMSALFMAAAGARRKNSSAGAGG